MDAKSKRNLRRWAKKTTQGMNQELQREARRNIKPIDVPVTPTTDGSLTIQNVYGSTINVHGDGNQVAVGNEGDVVQTGGSPALDIEALLGAVRDLQASTIEFGDAHVADEVHRLAEELKAQATVDEPDHGLLRRLAERIGQRLSTVPASAVGGFIAQGLAIAFLPS